MNKQKMIIPLCFLVLFLISPVVAAAADPSVDKDAVIRSLKDGSPNYDGIVKALKELRGNPS